jgi:hypothetical protein
MPLRNLAVTLGLFAIAGACDGSTVSSSADGGGLGGPVGSTSEVPGVALLSRMAGLWSGPATMTRLGDFPLLNMDFRPATSRVLFARVDMDAENSLRFALFVGMFGGKKVLTYRNGGLFKGLSRDSWTILKDVDENQGTYHFCSADRGCEYIDATFRFSAADSLVLDVTVRGAPHEHWSARRTETRPLPDPFPADLEVQGTGTEPFPEMPRLDATVSFGKTLAADADVWLMLSNGPCTSGGCLSRSFTAHAKAGSSTTSFAVDQIHAASYSVTAVLDADRNLGTTFAPSSGDGVSLPNQSLEVAATGSTQKTFPIVYTLP